MSRILVTGGAGYVGSACCRQLQARGHHVEVVDDLSTGHPEAVINTTPFDRWASAIPLIGIGLLLESIMIVNLVRQPKSPNAKEHR